MSHHEKDEKDKREEQDRNYRFPVFQFISLLSLLVPAAFVSGPAKDRTRPIVPLPCVHIENDAKNIRNALYDYLKQHEGYYVPSFELLEDIYNIKAQRYSNVVIAGTWEEPTITVFDTNDLCAKGSSYVVYMRQYISYWQR